MSSFETLYFDDVSQIPDETFEILGCQNSFYFEKKFLTAFAKANPSIEHRYLVILSQEKVAALAITQRLEVAVDNTTEKLSLPNKIAKTLQCYIDNRSVQIAVCGNVFLSGNYGVYIKEGVNPSTIYDHIASELKPLKTQKKASVFFLKDFNQRDLQFTNAVAKRQFVPFDVEPNMKLKVIWDTYEDYKQSLRSKYRVKVNKADTKSALLEVRSLNADDINYHKKRLQELYCNITDRALFKAVDMQMHTYALLKEHYGEKVFLNAYFNEEKIVGFATAFKVNDTLDAHFVGIDYNVNKELSIYPRILNDYVKMAIELKCKEVNFGRTSSEIKSTLGALPENLTCYVRHRRTVANMLFKPLIRQIKMTEYKQHRPFKKLKSS